MENTNPGSPTHLQQPVEEKPFYNVMPQSGGKGDIVEPTFKSVTTEAAAETPAAPSFIDKLKAYKLYVILAAVLVIGLPLGYFLISNLAGNSYEEEDLLVQQPHIVKNEGGQGTSSPPTIMSGEGVTTPQEWREKYFPACADIKLCGDNADPDRDGLGNLQENNLNTDPNNPDSDQDGLADGDEVNVFNSSPLNARTSGNQKYNDADYIKGGFDIITDKAMTQTEIAVLKAKMDKFDLHAATIITLGDVLNTLYNFSSIKDGESSTTGTTSPTSGLDESLGAQQDRDTQRSNAIKNIGGALVKYQADNKIYPLTGDFASMFVDIKPYLRVATNPTDPVNKEPYVYSYASNANGTDFSLSFYSEVAKQIIKKNASDALKDADAEEAAIYDNQRQNDLESLRIALLLYSQKNAAGNQDYVFPAKDKYKTLLVPEFITAIPRDPVSDQDYVYEVSAGFDAFTLKATLQSPPPGNTGYLCNQVDSCNYY